MEAIIRENWKNVIDSAVKRRKKLRLSQQQLAAISNVSQSTVSRFENGELRVELKYVLSILFQLGLRLSI